MGKKKKNPIRIRRDTKRREAFLVKKTESSVSVPNPEKDLASSLADSSAPATPRRLATAKRSRTLDLKSTGDEDREDSKIGGGYSPIPQLDGENFEETNIAIKPKPSLYFDPDELRKMFRGGEVFLVTGDLAQN